MVDLDVELLSEKKLILEEQVSFLQKKVAEMQKKGMENTGGSVSDRAYSVEKKSSHGSASFKKANDLFQKSEYIEAENEYRLLLETKPEFAFVINSFINRCISLRSASESTIGIAPKVGQVFDNKDSGWAAVITMYKRQDYLAEQLLAINSQSIPPKEIVIIQNENHMEIDKFLLEKYKVKLIRSDINSLYFRWIVGYLLDAEYICVFDDDVIPGNEWIESCKHACDLYNALVGPSGRRAAPYKKDRAWKSVENLSQTEYEYCDWVCNSYFFRKDWIKYVVEYARYLNTQKTFDDIQLAVSLKACGNINTIVPPQFDKKHKRNGHIKREYGHDEHALWKRSSSDHSDQRREMIQKLDENEFKWTKLSS